MIKLRAVQYGCGPIGCNVVRFANQRPDFQIVGAIDTDKSLVNRDIGEVAGTGRPLGVYISEQADNVLSQTKPDVAFLTTSSSLKSTYPQLEICLKAGVNVVSTCEELAYPYLKEPELSIKIDKMAIANKVTVLGTGVNPGFLMDSWPLFMTGVCQQVKRIHIVRVQDAFSRRGPFQKKIGAGCTLKEFEEKAAKGMLRHVGLAESVAMVADGLGWKLDDITESIEPIIAENSIKTDFVSITPGQTSGVKQIGRGISKAKELITLEFVAAVGAPESYDAVYIMGVPSLEVVIKGGTHGDIATAAIVVNCAHRVVAAAPGLITMKDLPLVSALGISH